METSKFFWFLVVFDNSMLSLEFLQGIIKKSLLAKNILFLKIVIFITTIIKMFKILKSEKCILIYH